MISLKNIIYIRHLAEIIMNKNAVVIIISAVVVLIVGMGLGILYQVQKAAPQLKFAANAQKVTSKAIASIAAYGKVSSVNGKNLAITYGADTLTISMKDELQMYSLASGAQKRIELKDLKPGDSVNVGMKMLPDGQLQGVSVMVLPPITAPAK